MSDECHVVPNMVRSTEGRLVLLAPGVSGSSGLTMIKARCYACLTKNKIK